MTQQHRSFWLFVYDVDAALLAAGLETLVTTNTIAHSSNAIDIAPLLIVPITFFLDSHSYIENVDQ